MGNSFFLFEPFPYSEKKTIYHFSFIISNRPASVRFEIILKCDHLQMCQKFLIITYARIKYAICHIFTKTKTFWYIDPKNFNGLCKMFTISACFLSLILKLCENKLGLSCRGAKMGGAWEQCSQKEIDRIDLGRRIWDKSTPLEINRLL